MITSNLTLDSTNWLEANFIEDEKVIHCESFSGHREHLQMLRNKASEYEVDLTEFEELIAECESNFEYPSEESIQEELEAQSIYDRKYLGIDYTNLEDKIYKVSLTNDDANGLIQVKTAFEFGVTETNFYFENGTIVPLKSIDDLFHLGQFIAIERNKFFL